MSDQKTAVQENGRLGVLLVNLGTPSAPTPRAIGRFLREFLSDSRVVDLPRLLWLPLLYGVVVPLRRGRVARQYQKIWFAEGSPLLVNSLRQLEGLRSQLRERESSVLVELGMTYGEPSIATGLNKLRDQQVSELLILPLYPQYSMTTTGAVFDAVARELKNWPYLPAMRMINHYADEPSYLEALASSVKAHWQQNPRGDCLLISFHGLPERYSRAGDPYYSQCLKTATGLAERLGLSEDQWRIVFQSRFGREAWLQPYCDKVLEALPAEGIRRVDIICPGFAADCLETLEEINCTNRSIFKAAGGEDYHYIPALNDRADHLNALVQIIKRYQPDLNENLSQVLCEV